MTGEPELSIVLPCYNEAPALAGLLERFAAAGHGHDFELLLVDNGSTDDTRAVLGKELAKPEYSFARVVSVPVNRGYGHGIHTGLDAARGRYLAWSHADFQCDPADVFRALDKLRTLAVPNCLVKGARRRRSFGEELLTVGMQIAARMILRQPLRDINGQPKIFHRSLMQHLAEPPGDFSFDLYVLYQALRAGWRIETIPVVFAARRHGTSKWAVGLKSRARHITATLVYMLWLRRSARP